jgi:S1-C subfamily serine protease
MDLLDLLVVTSAVAAGIGGHRIGLTARAASWIGLALGFVIAAKLLPSIVEGYGGDYQHLLLLELTVLLCGALAGQVIGLLIGQRVKVIIPPGPARTLDRAGGAVAGVFGVLVLLWLLLPTLAQTPEWPADQARNSAIADFIHEHFPDAPNTAKVIQRLLGPQVVEGLGAAPDLGTPPAGTNITRAVQDRVARSTVKVEAVACSRIQDGSGAVVGPGLVITNAHVVAGSEGTTVETFPDDRSLPADVVAFDPDRDVAVLRVQGLDRPALPLDNGSFGEGGVGAVFGHPRGGPLTPTPFLVGRKVTANGRDIYDEDITQRRVFFLASHLEPGDSGGALIDGNGTVVGMAFAIAPDRSNVAYALTIEEVTPVLRTVTSGPAGSSAVGTGQCIN